MKIVLLSPHARVPEKATAGAAGFDLYASHATIVPSGRVLAGAVSVGRALVHTGIAVQVPDGFVGRIGSRSGLSIEQNVEVGAGWIDPDFRGEILVELKNFSSEDFHVELGARVAQLFVIPVSGDPRLEVVDALPPSGRGAKGFGSTGR